MTELWNNWSGDQRCAPTRIARPTSEAELCNVVGQAAAAGLNVRAAGSGHSFTDAVCTDGVLIDTTGLQRVLDVDTSAGDGSGRVTVEAGIKLHTLGAENAKHGLALENQGDIDAQALAGAIATATHGTGLAFGNMATRVVGMRLVTGDGSVVEVDEDDPETLLAARVGVGSLGIASQVTIECVPLYTLERFDAPRPLDETLNQLDDLVEGNDHFEFFLWPYTDTAMTRRMMRTDADPWPRAKWKQVLQEDVIENGLLGTICRTGRRFPSQVPRLNRVIERALSGGRATDHAYRIYATKRAVRFNEMEYAIPRAHAREALGRAMELVERRNLPILFPFEMRFTAGDDAFLSTAHGRETCYIAAHQYAGMEFETFFRAFEEIMDSYGGRPHWGKRHYQTAETLAPRYPEWDRFQAVRARLDPNGVFLNDYTRRVLGPVGSGVAR